MNSGFNNFMFREDLLSLPHDEFVQRVQEMEIDWIHQNQCEETPLHELIKRGLDINAIGEDGTTLLSNAVENDDVEETCMLLYYGADVNMPNEFNQKVLNIALSNYHLNIALILMDFCDDLRNTNVYSTSIALLCKDSRLSGQLLLNANLEKILVTYFKQFSYKIHQELISNTQILFLADFIQFCDYTGSNFLECFNAILDFPNSRFLLQNFKGKYHTENFYNLLYCFLEKNINRQDRTATIWAWMSLGAKVSVSNINLTFYFFGFNGEVETLICTTGESTVCCVRTLTLDILPLTIFILALEKDCSTVSIFECYLENWYKKGIPKFISFSRGDIDFNAKQVVLNSLRYFTIPPSLKLLFLNQFKNTVLHCTEIVDVFEKLPRVPTLIELSRDQARRYIRQVHEIKKPYQFHEAVKNLNVPLIIKDIIRFKRPIYY